MSRYTLRRPTDAAAQLASRVCANPDAAAVADTTKRTEFVGRRVHGLVGPCRHLAVSQP